MLRRGFKIMHICLLKAEQNNFKVYRIEKVFLLILSCLITQLACFSQPSLPIPYNGEFEHVTIPCPYNPDILIETELKWYAYQTLDNTYNGTIDSNYCIGLAVDTSIDQYTINVSDFDTTRPLFIKANLDSTNWIPLSINSLYSIDGNLFSSILPDNAIVSDSCEEEICTGIILTIINLTDSFGNYDNTYFFPANYNPDWYWDSPYCFATEKYSQSYLSQFIYKLSLKNLPPIIQYSNYAATLNYLEPTTPVVDYVPYTSSYFYHDDFYAEVDSYYPTNILFMHNNPGYPSPENTDTCFLTPSPNPDNATNIYFTVSDYVSLHFQSFVSIMGSMDALDNQRHSLDIINESGNICFGFFDVRIGNGVRLIQKYGDLNLPSTRSCLMLENGGAFSLADSISFSYGQNGVGILGMQPGSTIEIGNQSELLFEGNLRLFGLESDSRSVYINLQEGTKFQFGTESHLLRGNIYAKNMQLCFYMNGGVLDDSALSAEERSMIRRIYPSESEELAGDVLIVPNPAGNNAIMEFIADESGLLYWEIFDVSGTLMTAGNTNLAAGIHTIDLPIDNLPSGLYLVHCRFNEQSTAKKLSVL